MLPHPARMCKHMRWGLMQRFLSAGISVAMSLLSQQLCLVLCVEALLVLACYVSVCCELIEAFAESWLTVASSM